MGTTANGNGGPSDGVYFRAEFDRTASVLGAGENILVVMEYSAAALRPTPAVPTQCFVGGVFNPESCSDMVWKTYLKHTGTEIVQPYLMLVPPALGSVNPTFPVGKGTGGSGISAKQFYIPLAGDANLKFLQISRVGSSLNVTTPNFATTCAPSGTGNSPHCVGMIIYSITFYRI